MPNRYTDWAAVGPVRNVVHNPETIRRLQGGQFDKTYGYITTETGERIVYEGMWVARHSTSYKFLPYHSGAAYGPGSDTIVGLLDERLDVTHFDGQCAPIYHGEVQKRWTYAFGSALGTVPAGVATDLPDIHTKPEVG